MESVGTWFSVHGRLRRAAWLWRSVSLGLIAITLGILAGLIAGEPAQALVAGLFLWLASVLAIRRLHDRGLSGLLLILLLVPVLGPLWCLVQLLRRGAAGSNRFGPDPRACAGYLQVDTSRPGA